MSSVTPTVPPVVPPEEFVCPISFELMTDPVLVSDGQTYNRPALLQWVQTRQAQGYPATSPLTNEQINPDSLVRNYALKAAIERWQTQHGPSVAVAPPQRNPVRRRFKLAKNRSGRAYLTCETDEPNETIVILMLDNSGSMASSGQQNQNAEGGNYSRNDLTRHSARTVATMLAERNDSGASPTYLAIGKFSSTASIIMPLRQMTQEGLAVANAALNTIQPEGATHMWDGLRVALDTAARAARMHPDANIQVFFLTDGEPSMDLLPMEGLEKSLTRKLAAISVPVTINAFGFGYSLDTALLRMVAETGGGIYGYIPDCRLAGTVFVHAVANALASVSHNTRVRWMGTEYVLGSLQAGFNKTFMMNYPEAGGSTSEAEVLYGLDGCEKVLIEQIDVDTSVEDGCDKVCELITEILSHPFSPVAAGAVRSLAKELEKAGMGSPALLADLVDPDDNKGQIEKAVSRSDWFASWGKNHLTSYGLALARQQCVNFKDQALQEFLSPRVLTLREMGSTIFDNLPPPLPSIPSYSAGGGAGGAVATMAVFNNATDGCFTGNTPILMANGKTKYAGDIKPGDRVAGGHKVLARITTAVGAKITLVRCGEMTLTPWHPVRRQYMWEWFFPDTLASTDNQVKKVEEFVHSVYNFVLETGHVVQSGEWVACTLGHGFTGEVIEHAYFGTDRVLQDLRRAPSWAMGYVNIPAGPMGWQRDPETGLVCGIGAF